MLENLTRSIYLNNQAIRITHFKDYSLLLNITQILTIKPYYKSRSNNHFGLRSSTIMD